jgi:VanZ family protein
VYNLKPGSNTGSRILAIVKNFWPGILWWCLVMFLTLSPGSYFPKISSFWNLFSPDKLVHLFIFGVLSFLLLKGNEKQYGITGNRYKILVPLLIAILTGISTELLQAIMPVGREASQYDAIANIAGCFTGYIIFRKFKNKKDNLLQLNQKKL